MARTALGDLILRPSSCTGCGAPRICPNAAILVKLGQWLQWQPQGSRDSELQHSADFSGESSPPWWAMHATRVHPGKQNTVDSCGGGRVLVSGKGSDEEALLNGLVICKGPTPCVQPLRDDLVMLAAQANCTCVDHQFDHQCWLRRRTADKSHIRRTPRLPPKPSSMQGVPSVSMQPVFPAGEAHPGSRRCASPSQLLGCKGGEQWLQGHLGSRRCGAGSPTPPSRRLCIS